MTASGKCGCAVKHRICYPCRSVVRKKSEPSVMDGCATCPPRLRQRPVRWLASNRLATRLATKPMFPSDSKRVNYRNDQPRRRPSILCLTSCLTTKCCSLYASAKRSWMTRRHGATTWGRLFVTVGRPRKQSTRLKPWLNDGMHCAIGSKRRGDRARGTPSFLKCLFIAV